MRVEPVCFSDQITAQHIRRKDPMENRFGIKDFFTFILLFAIIALVVIGMKQFDRQYQEIRKLQTQTSALTNDLNNIRREASSLAEEVSGLRADIRAGIKVSGVAPQSGVATDISAPKTEFGDMFAAIRRAEQLPGFARGDWLVENFGTSLGRITPYITTDVYGSIVQAKVSETLAMRDPATLEFVPVLASRWQKSSDGKTITFDLRRGVTFSDGVPFTSADVKFTFDWVMNPQVDAPRVRSYLDKIESVEVEGDYRVSFKFKEFVFNGFETVAGLSILPKHFYEKFTPREFNENPGLLLGTGPYRMATADGWRPGTRVELFRNERYWGVQPPFDRLVYYEVQDDVVEETMFRNREIDRLASTPESFGKLKDDPAIISRAKPFSFYSPLGGYTYLGWNQRRKEGDAFIPTPFADKRVRQAMTMLIDRQRMAQELWFGFAKPAVGPFAVDSPQNDPTLEPWPYDPERAGKLLDEAGWTDRNRDGVRESESGQPLRFKLSYPSGNPFTDRIVLFIKDAYAKQGVRVELDAVDWPIFLKKLDSRDFEACTLAWTTSIETDTNQIFHSDQTKDNGDNFVNYVNPELDRAIEKARATVDDAERMKAWQAVHRIIWEDQPYTFLLNRMSLQFIDSRIQNVETSKMGLNYVWQEPSPFPWFVPADQQLRKSQP
jgi:peptide/nickel transport system substrate-binding protein